LITSSAKFINQTDMGDSECAIDEAAATGPKKLYELGDLKGFEIIESLSAVAVIALGEFGHPAVAVKTADVGPKVQELNKEINIYAGKPQRVESAGIGSSPRT
jgi:hypothetical protein